MSHKIQAQIAKQKRQQVEFDDDYAESVWQCIRSGQVSADQVAAHVQAGEINQGASDGRNTEE